MNKRDSLKCSQNPICNYCYRKYVCFLNKSDSNYYSKKESKIRIPKNLVKEINVESKFFFLKRTCWHDARIFLSREFYLTEYTINKLYNYGLNPYYYPKKFQPWNKRNNIPDEILYHKGYLAFKEYIKNNNNYVIMDTVQPPKDFSKSLLTLYWPDTMLLYIQILPSCKSDCVIAALNNIEAKLGTNLFKQMFPAILTDTGYEFLETSTMECSYYSLENKRTNIYYSDDGNHEKGKLEQVHKFIRKAIPTGFSFDPYNQDDMFTLMAHINSKLRKQSKYLTPFERAAIDYPYDFMFNLCFDSVDIDEVNLSLDLLMESKLDFYCIE